MTLTGNAWCILHRYSPPPPRWYVKQNTATDRVANSCHRNNTDTIYTFWRLLPRNGIVPGAKVSLCVQVLRSSILAALLHGTRAVGISQTLRCGTRNGITELLVLVIFNRGATYTLGIGPRSSCLHNSSFVYVFLLHKLLCT